jgi:O-antigen/teichoic acid export membrane protein
MKQTAILGNWSFLDRHRARTLEWGRLLSITGGAQILVQVLGFLSGLLVIRLLSANQYAFYTIANTTLGTMTVLADGGISVGVISIGAKVWQNRATLGGVLAAGLHLRKRFAIASLVVTAPVLIFLLRHQGASWLVAVLILVSLIPAFLAALSDSLLEVAPKLRQDVVPLQRNQIAASVARLALTAIGVVALPLAATGILAAGISRAWANLRLRKIASSHADWRREPDRAAQKDILAMVRRILPASIYYCFSGQITIWLISIFGSTMALSQVGALSGLSTAMGLFTAVFTTLIVPRFARLPNLKSLIVKRFALLQVGLIIMSILIVTCTGIFSKEILWVVGKRFAGLQTELILVAAGSCITLMGASTNQLLSARGIVVPPLAFISLAIAAQMGLAFVVPLNNVVGILQYGIYTSLAIYMIRLIYFVLGPQPNEAPS